MILRATMVACLLSSPFLFGCGKRAGQQRTHDVSGRVTMGGSPVPGATVTFSPVGSQPAAFGRTDAEGRYTLTTYDAGDGAAEGEFKVLVTKTAPVTAAATAPEGGHDPDHPTGGFDSAAQHAAGGRGGAQADAGGGHLLPEKYSRAATSDLTAVVTAGGDNTHNFELSP